MLTHHANFHPRQRWAGLIVDHHRRPSKCMATHQPVQACPRAPRQTTTAFQTYYIVCTLLHDATSIGTRIGTGTGKQELELQLEREYYYYLPPCSRSSCILASDLTNASCRSYPFQPTLDTTAEYLTRPLGKSREILRYEGQENSCRLRSYWWASGAMTEWLR